MENLEQVFNQIVKDYSERLYWHVRRMVGTHEDADDLLQDIFLKIWTALPSFRGEAQLYTWVWRIATNETLNWLRRERVRAALRFQSIDAGSWPILILMVQTPSGNCSKRYPACRKNSARCL